MDPALRLYALVTWLSLDSSALHSRLHLPTSLCRKVPGLAVPRASSPVRCSHSRRRSCRWSFTPTTRSDLSPHPPPPPPLTSMLSDPAGWLQTPGPTGPAHSPADCRKLRHYHASPDQVICKKNMARETGPEGGRTDRKCGGGFWFCSSLTPPFSSPSKSHPQQERPQGSGSRWKLGSAHPPGHPLLQVTLVWSSAQPRNHLLLPVFPGCLLHALIHREELKLGFVFLISVPQTQLKSRPGQGAVYHLHTHRVTDCWKGPVGPLP